MRCEWKTLPDWKRKAGPEQCPNEARWEKEDKRGTWHLCDTHKRNYVEGMNNEYARKEETFWRPI